MTPALRRIQKGIHLSLTYNSQAHLEGKSDEIQPVDTNSAQRQTAQPNALRNIFNTTAASCENRIIIEFRQMLTCMKGFTGFGAIIILIIGLGMTGVTIFGYFHSELFLNNLNYRNIILGILLGADLIIVVGAIIGIIGIRKGTACFICLFQLIVMIFLVVFLAIGISAVVLPSQFFNGNCTDSTNSVVQDVGRLYNVSLGLLCVPLRCQCLMTEQAYARYSPVQKLAMNVTTNPNISKVVNTLDCANYHPQPSDEALIYVLGQIERSLSCSMWCENATFNWFYRFSDVSNGIPESTCYIEMKDALNKYGTIVGIAAFVTFAFLLLLCLCNICICCHKDRKRLSMRDRFVYLNEDSYQKV